MDRRVLVAAGAAVLIIFLVISLLLGFGSRIFDRKEPRLTERENTLKLAELYMEKAEYDRALDLLDKLLLGNPNDSEALELQDKVLAAKRKAEGKGEEATEKAQAVAEGRGNVSEKESETAEETENIEEGASTRVAVVSTLKREDPAAAADKAERAKRDRIQKLLAEGEERMRRKDYEGARKNLTKRSNWIPILR